MAKKISSMLLIFVLLSQTIVSGLFSPLVLAATEETSHIITDVIVTDEKEQLIDAKSNPTHEQSVEDFIYVQFNWTLPDTEQQIYEIQLPEQLLFSEQEGILVVKNEEIGTYHTTEEHSVVITINDDVTVNDTATGTFRLEAAWNTELLEVPLQIELPFVIGENEIIIPISLTSTKEEIIDEEIQEEKVDNEIAEELKKPEKELETAIQMEKAAVEITENILTNFELTLRDGSPLPNPMPNPFEQELELKAAYTFVLPNDHGYGAGSTYTFELPEQLKVYNVINGQLDEYGTFTITTEGIVTLTFNENIEKYLDIEGWLEVYTVIDKESVEDTEETIIVDIKDNIQKEITIHFTPKPGNTIDKSGQPDRWYNANSIRWTIDFNKGLDTLPNAVLYDPIEDVNQAFIDGSIKIYELDVKLDGTAVQGDDVTASFANTFPIDFGTINNQAYRVVFETEILDEDANHYPNKATIKWSNNEEASASASIYVTRGKHLEKTSTAYDPVNQTITWEIRYNYNEKSIQQNDAKLVDVFTDLHQLVDGSFEVYEVDIDDTNGHVIGETVFTNYDVIEEGSGFTFQFNQDINKAYKIKYKTEAPNRITDYQNIHNKVTTDEGEAESNRGVNQEIIHKSHYDPNYDEKTVKWGISINRDQHYMDNVVIVDTLPSGVTMESYTITHGGSPLAVDEDFTYQYDETTGKVTFRIHEAITKEVYIELKTKFDYNEAENKGLRNIVNVTWIPEGEQTELEKEAETTFWPNWETQINGSKSGSYNAVTKEITWTIGVNYNKREIEEALVKDIIQGNQNLLLDSIQIYKMKIHQGGGWQKDGEPLAESEYEVEEIVEDGKPGFVINLGNIHSAYIVEFKTSLEDELIVHEYRNKAFLIDDDKEYPLEASVWVNKGGNYTEKGAYQDEQNERILHWNVKINSTQSTIQDAKLTDKPSGNQVILKDSFKLYGTNVNPNGKIEKNDANLLKLDEDYTLTFKTDENDLEYFELDFVEEISRPYILEYDTYLMAGHGEKVNNDATLTGKNITVENTDSSAEHIVYYSAGDGGAVGKVGKLTLTKVDSKTNLPLEGVEFTLFDQTGQMPLYTADTNENGTIIFERLRVGKYILKETQGLDGYINNYKEGMEVIIDKEVTDNSPEGNTLVVENDPLVYAVQLKKVDEDHPEKTLAGAAFELQKLINGDYVTVNENIETDEDGLIYLDNLDVGTYQFVETKAPENYLLLIDPVPFVIEDDNTEVVTVTAMNKEINRINIAGEKTWKDGESETRPETIYVDLLQNGKVIQTEEVSASDNWHYEFRSLLETDSNGNKYQYTVKEQAVNGYESIVDGYDIINLRVGTTAVEGTKTWKDDNSEERPESITVNLLQNGKVIDTKEVTAETDWTYSFEELPKYDEEGVAYDYTVSEATVEGYETIVEGYDITNLRVGTTAVEGTKTWKDDNSEERPESITVNLLQNGEIIDTKEVTAETDWNYSFDELPKYDEEGVAYAYTVSEEAVEGYETTVEGYDITNLRVGTTAVEGTKTWKDDNSEERPESITVNLLQNGIVFATKEVTAENDWTYSFEELPKYDEEGVAYEYTITEHGVPGYKTEIDGYDIVNTRSELTSVHVTKGWKDEGETSRPETITVHLHQNGTIVDTVELSIATNWSHTFEDLQAYDEDGKANVYTISEEEVEGYTTIIEGYDITNIRTGNIDIKGTKTWDDNNYSNRPESITVELLRNGEVIQTVEVTEKTIWTYHFDKLAEFDENGLPYLYTVNEQPVEGYVATIDQYDITNKLIFGSVNLIKVDADDHKQGLEGAVFTLFDESGNVIKEGLTTDENGEIIVDQLHPGKYYFQETKAPTGYVLDASKHSFKVDIGQEEMITIQVENEKVPVDPKKPSEEDPIKEDPKEEQPQNEVLPNTATSIYNYLVVGLVLLLLGGVLAYRLKQK
ncbi:Cna B-type domain-containing protein [Gracilibacillus marinus]|uniref:Cna B-type domain-containing protein n=1 Tax=Gracilibacillus marinus TaxID=630535 RepID=A0ABV8VQE7_9BACI